MNVHEVFKIKKYYIAFNYYFELDVSSFIATGQFGTHIDLSISFVFAVIIELLIAM